MLLREIRLSISSFLIFFFGCERRCSVEISLKVYRLFPASFQHAKRRLYGSFNKLDDIPRSMKHYFVELGLNICTMKRAAGQEGFCLRRWRVQTFNSFHPFGDGLDVRGLLG